MTLTPKKLLWAVVIILPIFIWASYSYSLFWKEHRESIHVAIVGPMSGNNAATWKLTVQAAQLYVDTLNKKEGVNGKQIILDVFDDQNDPVKANARALEIVEQGRAVAVIGHDYSSCSESGGKVYAKYGIPAVSTSSTNVEVTENNDWYFRTIFNDKLQGRLLAHYAKKVLGHQTVSIIHKDRTQGNYLAQVFEDTATKLGVEVKHKWAFDEKADNATQVLTGIVEYLRARKDAGLIFLAVHATEGIQLVKLIKDAGIQNPIIMSEDLASKTFQQGFNHFPKEKLKPGYYTNGLYVTTPLIFDTANEKAQHFKEVYRARYQEQPDETAAFAYDAAMVIVKAIKKTDVQGQSATIKDDRQKIRDYLAGMTTIDGAVEGASGLNYFDQAGNAQKPISIGVYKHRKIVSASTQLQMVRDLNEISNLDSALNKEHVLLIDDKYMYKTNVVYTGIKMNEISELDLTNLTYQLDFYLWFRFEGEFNTKNIEFINADEPITIGEPVIEKEGHKTRHLYRIKGRFKADFLPNHVYYQQHILGISFRHRELTRDNLIYVTDVLGLGLTNGELWLDKVQKSQLLSPVYEWAITHAWFFQDITRKSSLGRIKYLDVQSGAIEYSRFNAVIQINHNAFSLRRMIPSQLAHYLLIVSGILLLLVALFDHKFRCFHKAIWFVQALLVFLVLLSSEVILVNRLVEETTTYQLKNLITAFDVLWWITQAFLLNLFVKRFLWMPLEERTGRTIPNVVRLFVATVIYMLAGFGIIAFIYDQPLTSLLATSGVVAMIVGLAIQVNISNVFSGIVINLERPFRVDDWVKIQTSKAQTEGKVVDITWRTTRILTKDGYILSIPNSVASEAIVHNYNYPDEPCKSSLNLRIDYTHPPEKVEKILLDALLSTEGILSNPAPTAFFDGFSDWAADYSVSFYVSSYAQQDDYNKKVWKRIWIHLQRAGIVPAVQRQEVHTFTGVKERSLEKTVNPIILLHEIDVFMPFSDEHKASLSDKMRCHHFAAGEIIFRQGEAGNSLFIIAEGVVSICMRLENDHPLEVARLGAGSFFGEVAVLTGKERMAAVTALTKTVLFEIVKADILPLIQEQPQVAQLISTVLTQRQQKTESQIKLRHEFVVEKEDIYQRILRGIWNFFGL